MFELDVLKTRCPSCLKLYSVERRDVVAIEPRFRCSSCQAYFAFHVPLLGNESSSLPEEKEMKSFLVDWPKMPLMIESTPPAALPEAEPTREKTSGREFKTTLRVREQWDRILANYEDDFRHHIFLKYCRDDN